MRMLDRFFCFFVLGMLWEFTRDGYCFKIERAGGTGN